MVVGPSWPLLSANAPSHTRTVSRYNHAMRQRTTVKSPPVSPILMLTFVLMFPLIVSSTDRRVGLYFLRRTSGARYCPKQLEARAWSASSGKMCRQRTGSRWNARSLLITSACNPERNTRPLGHAGAVSRMAVERFRARRSENRAERKHHRCDLHHHSEWRGMNGTSGNENGGSRPLPSAPQHMMTVWQKQKSGWVVIAHSVSQSSISQ